MAKTKTYCMNCGGKNEIKNHKVQIKCAKCGKFLTLPIVIDGLPPKRTSEIVYKTTK